jgi:hypothetical protein
MIGLPPVTAAHSELTPGERIAVVSAARTFATAYLAYEVGRLSGHLRSALEDVATPALARAVTRKVVRFAGQRNVPGSRLVSLQLEGRASDRTADVGVLVDHAGWFSRLLLTVTRSGDRWLVTNLN